MALCCCPAPDSAGQLTPSLLMPADKDRIAAIEIFEDWLQEISLLDEEITADLKHIADFASEHIAKRQRLDNKPHAPSYNPFPQSQRDSPAFVPPLSGANAINSMASRGGFRPPNNARSGRRTRCPKLLPSEYELLDKHSGCKKCRKFYVNHQVANCPNDFPNPDSYVTLTEQMALQAMATAAIASTYNGNTPSSSSINTPFIPQTTYHTQTTSFVEEIPNDTTSGQVQNSVAAMLPSSSSTPFVLGTGESDTESNSSTVSPISVPHYIWHANVHGTSEFPTPVNCLLDNGAHLVLIRPETVAELGLKIRKLHKPQLATVAINSQHHTFHLADYVLLTLSSLNNAWTSRPVRALVAADLCINILLGLPFLKHNKIVIDHDADTAIDKLSGFDLLNENKPSALTTLSPRRLSPKQRRDTLLHNRRLMIEELKWRCHERRIVLEQNNLFESTTSHNYIASIRDTIQRLASKQELQHLETSMKEEFKKIFEPIPHINCLPPHEPARIHLQDAYKKISNRSYSCPRQYKDAFATLIQQRLDSGFIRPSSSFASPSFIVPKKDPKALPHWVCDYRQLNSNTIPDNFPLPRIEEILADCGKGNIWSTIDMTDSFFQTRIHPDDIHKTAITTPLGAYEWLVMPMGLRNSPPIHQRRVMTVLHKYIGKICHVYMDNIVVWSNSLEEHEKHVRLILLALQEACLYINKKKTNLFCYNISFLGHNISQKGIQADASKVDKILDWPAPKNQKQVQQFLGLVKYLSAFLPHLAIQSSILSRLTTRDHHG
jgi:Reverse transcriptase (RNA-dependent DNA polymerase)/Aspartyl protease